MSKKIIFKPSIPEEYLAGNVPVPAVKAIPEWFKKFGRYKGGSKKIEHYADGNQNTTIKACPPIMDAFSTGYIITLRSDIFVRNENDEIFVTWSYGTPEFVSNHHQDQVPDALVPEYCNPKPFKFENAWSMILPKGYSALITHPFNRNDLPFLTLSGVVDLDGYHNTVNLPFLFKKNASGIIPAGTPIAQVFPFKREAWQHSIEEHDPKFTQAQFSKVKSKIEKGYKLLDWNRKDFK